MEREHGNEIVRNRFQQADRGGLILSGAGLFFVRSGNAKGIAMTVQRTWGDAMSEAAHSLRSAGVDSPRRDARLLLAHAMGVEPIDIILLETEYVDPAVLPVFNEFVRRRLDHEPVSRIRGWREFYGRRFTVTPDVLDPRPETELLVHEGIRRLPSGGRVLDLGVGSGCILLSMLAERPDARGVGLDISHAALQVARSNADRLGLHARAEFVEGGWQQDDLGHFDLVLSNPPYIADNEMAGLSRDVSEYDPLIALTPGSDGLAAYRDIFAAMPRWLRDEGAIGVEFGSGQAGDVVALMRQAGLCDIAVHHDLAGRERVAFGKRSLHRPGGGM